MTIGAGALSLALGGCATLDRGSSDRIFFVSDPAGAVATMSSGQTCTTPCNLLVGRHDTFSVSFAKAGFQPATVDVATRISATGVGDFGENIMTLGGGAAVDAATGAVLDHDPNPVRVTLVPLSKPAPTKRPVPRSSS